MFVWLLTQRPRNHDPPVAIMVAKIAIIFLSAKQFSKKHAKQMKNG